LSPRPQLLPYTTFFRSRHVKIIDGTMTDEKGVKVVTLERAEAKLDGLGLLIRRLELFDLVVDKARVQMTMSKDPEGTFDLLEARSEEHTSELQSRENLV